MCTEHWLYARPWDLFSQSSHIVLCAGGQLPSPGFPLWGAGGAGKQTQKRPAARPSPAPSGPRQPALRLSVRPSHLRPSAPTYDWTLPSPLQRTCLQLSSSSPASFTSSVRNIPSHTHAQAPAAAMSLLPASNMYCASEPTQVSFPPYTPHRKGSRDPCGHSQTQLSVLVSRDLLAQGTPLASPSHLKHFPSGLPGPSQTLGLWQAPRSLLFSSQTSSCSALAETGVFSPLHTPSTTAVSVEVVQKTEKEMKLLCFPPLLTVLLPLHC